MNTAPIFEQLPMSPSVGEAPTGGSIDLAHKRPLPTLIEAEEWLQELVDTAGIATPEQEEKLGLVIQEALAVAQDKRQAVAEAILHFEEQAEFAKKYSKDIAERGRRFAKIAEGIRTWVLRYIERLPVVDHGRRAGLLPVLEGHTLKMSARAIANQVQYTSPGSIPLEYQTATVTVPAITWVKIMRAVRSVDESLLPDSAEMPAVTYGIDGAAVKKALEDWYPFRDQPCPGKCVEGRMPAGTPCPKCNGRGKIRMESPVPGAELIVGRNTLQVR
jgi:hypothetical protein